MSWEIIAKNILQVPQLETHLKTYLGIDITDKEMSNNVFAKSRNKVGSSTQSHLLIE